jgi:hypothetical protein
MPQAPRTGVPAVPRAGEGNGTMRFRLGTCADPRLRATAKGRDHRCEMHSSALGRAMPAPDVGVPAETFRRSRPPMRHGRGIEAGEFRAAALLVHKRCRDLPRRTAGRCAWPRQRKTRPHRSAPTAAVRARRRGRQCRRVGSSYRLVDLVHPASRALRFRRGPVATRGGPPAPPPQVGQAGTGTRPTAVSYRLPRYSQPSCWRTPTISR